MIVELLTAVGHWMVERPRNVAIVIATGVFVEVMLKALAR